MDFRKIPLLNIYDTSSLNLGEAFFQPVLANAIFYDRGVGFFTSGWLRNNAFGLTKFAEHGGYARWITSPILNEKDWQAMKLGIQAKEDTLTKIMLDIWVKDIKEQLENDTLTSLAWLIYDDVISFKIAVPRNKLCGEFHDKFGIFTDPLGNQIAFSGSYNDTINGENNYESIKVFNSWTAPLNEFISQEQTRFERLWNNEDPNVKVFSLPDAIKNEIARCRSIERPYKKNDRVKTENLISIYSFTNPQQPKNLQLREYQNKAIVSWLENNNNGILEMATGTGKTITSLSASIRIFKRDGKIALIIVCPFTHLVEQWKKNAECFQYNPILAYQSKITWLDKLNNYIVAYNNGYKNQLCCITTTSTFVSNDFINSIQRIKDPIMIIADEAHYFGANLTKTKIPTKIKYRLGLTATPQRWFDKEGSNFLLSYFNGIVFSYTLEDAIKNGYLTHYDYFPVLVDLRNNELDDYSILTKKIINLLRKAEKDKSAKEKLDLLLIKRSNILKNAANKFESLKEILQSIDSVDHTIFYCSPQQKEGLLRLLGIDLKIRTHQFTYQETNMERQLILERFDKGILHALIAMKCLDEGVDIPSTKSAFFLANSTNPKEFIQRRGRVLRKSSGKEKAYLYDFIVVPPSSDDEAERNLSKGIIQKELSRFSEFVEQADNYFSAHEVIWDIAQFFGIDDF